MGLTLDVFVSSPGDMAKEREVVAEVVAKLAEKPHIRRSCTLRAHFYERMVPPALASSAQAAVNTFMMDPARCDVMVCLLGKRLGTAFKDPALDPRSFRSGTEFEIVRAYESSKKPKPEILLYHRVRQDDPQGDSREEARVAEFLAEFKGDNARFRGIPPAPFQDADRLRAEIEGGLDAVVDRLVHAYVVRRWILGVSLVAAIAAALVGSYLLAQWRQSKTARRDQAQAVLDAVLRDDWTPIAELDRLGCPAAKPLVDALSKLNDHAAGHIRSAVWALGKLAAGEDRERCGCPELLSVLALENVTARYSKITHKIVLEELGRVTCRARDSLVCGYLGKIQALQPLADVVSEGRVDDVTDLNAAAGKWLGPEKLQRCQQRGVLQ
jgi:hypothetical protein